MNIALRTFCGIYLISDIFQYFDNVEIGETKNKLSIFTRGLVIPISNEEYFYMVALKCNIYKEFIEPIIQKYISNPKLLNSLNIVLQTELGIESFKGYSPKKSYLLDKIGNDIKIFREKHKLSDELSPSEYLKLFKSTESFKEIKNISEDDYVVFNKETFEYIAAIFEAREYLKHY